MTTSAASSFASGVAYATAGALLWGFSGACSQYLFARYAITAAFITAVRALVAGVLFVGVLAFRQRAKLTAMLGDSRTRRRLLVFGVGLFGSQFCFAESVSFTNAGTATVLQMSGTVFIMLFTCAFARCLPRAREVAGLVCAVAATWLIATQGDPHAIALPVGGLVWGLLNGLAVALYVMYPRRLFDAYGSFASTGLAMLVCGVLSCAVWLVQEAAVPGLVAGANMGAGVSATAVADAGVSTATVVSSGANAVASTSSGTLALIPALDATGWLVLLGGIAVVGTFAAFALYLQGVSVVGSVAGGLLGTFEPLGAMVVSAVWLATAFSAADWAGFALMIVMLVLVTLPSRKDVGSA